MLAETIADLIPAALAVSLSPLPIVAIVLVLGGPTARASGIAFALAWLVGVTVVSTVVVLVAVGAEDTHSPASNLADIGKVVFGILLLALAVRKWRGRETASDATKTPGWMASLAAISPPAALKLGLLVSANPKNLVLALAAGASIAQAGLTTGEKAIAIAAFAILSSATVLAPVGFYLLDADRAAAPLASVKRFMSDNSAVILMIVMFILGAKLVADGIAGLLT